MKMVAKYHWKRIEYDSKDIVKIAREMMETDKYKKIGHVYYKDTINCMSFRYRDNIDDTVVIPTIVSFLHNLQQHKDEYDSRLPVCLYKLCYNTCSGHILIPRMGYINRYINKDDVLAPFNNETKYERALELRGSFLACIDNALRDSLEPRLVCEEDGSFTFSYYNGRKRVTRVLR